MKKRLTSHDVAKAAGVSQSLVSLILNNVPGKKIKPETRAHVLKIADDIGYRVNIHARDMRSRKVSAIGLLSSWDAHSFVFPPVVKGVKSICFENELAVVICSSEKNSRGSYDFVDYYLQNRINGVVFISHVGITEDGIIAELKNAGIPFVCIIGARDLSDVSCVDVNFVESGYLAVRHLVENGYRNIAYIMEDEQNALNYAEKERYAGCMNAAHEYKIKLFPIEHSNTANVESDFEQKADLILNHSEIDAVISTSPKCFVMLKAAMKRNINVPKSLGVISLDNDLYAPYLTPALTTIDEPLIEIATSAMNILLDKLNGLQECKKLEISPSISVRESTRRKD